MSLDDVRNRFETRERLMTLMREAHHKVDVAFAPGCGGSLDDLCAVTFTKAECAVVLASLEGVAQSIGEELA